MFEITDADLYSMFKDCLAMLHFDRESTFKNDFVKYALVFAMAALTENDRALQESLDMLVAIHRRFTEHTN